VSNVKRRLLNLLTLVSLVLCAAVCVLGVRSLWVIDTPYVNAGRYQWCANSEFGKITTGWQTAFLPRAGAQIGWTVRPHGPHESPWEARHYLLYFGVNDGSTWNNGTAHVPHWPLALATAAPPAAWLWRRRKRNRRDGAGFCPRCGDDLRASPEKSPECGTAAAVGSSG
jgi:hypothetical protein